MKIGEVVTQFYGQIKQFLVIVSTLQHTHTQDLAEAEADDNDPTASSCHVISADTSMASVGSADSDDMEDTTS